MNYIVTVDNKGFTNKEEALKYLEDNFLVKQDTENEPDEIVERIKFELPDGVNVSISYDTNGFCKYIVSAGNEDFNIDAYLEIGAKTFGGLYNSVESVVEFFAWAVPLTMKIIDRAKSQYSFKSFRLDRHHDDYGNGHYFDFVYETSEGITGQATYEYGEVDDFIKQFDQHFTNSLVGVPTEIYVSGGYYDGQSIDNVPIRGLFDRAATLGKRVRLEIID